ncbi:MAG TPA: sulfatase-like hydrolase/transferase [Bryobacteraceae bacterium]
MSGTLSRKQFLQTAALLPGAAAAQTSPTRPNILLLMTDQHRREYMTCAGNDLVPTPNIDRIASRGVRFTNAICPYPVCAASRASLLSGLYPHNHRVIANTDLLDWRTRTVAHHFADAGYHTGLIGKMHFNDGHTHGFQYFLGFNDWFMYLGPKVQAYADEIANHPIGPHFFDTVNDDGSGLPELPSVWGGKLPWAGHVNRMGLASELDPDDQFDAFVARESVRFLERHGQSHEPFFLVTSFLKPHPPLHPPKPWDQRYPIDKTELPPIGDVTQYPKSVQQRIAGFQKLGNDRLKAHRSGYPGNLAYVDTCVGEVYKALERLNLLQNTIVVYTADHGEMDGDHGLYQKFCLFDPSVGVPLIVSHPSRLPEGKVSHQLVEYLGIYPTLAELTGTPGPQSLDAASFAPFIRNPEAKGPEAIFSEYNLKSKTDCYMVRTPRYKYIYNRNDIPELYDLEADPKETTNRQSDPGLAKLKRNLEDRLRSWHTI